MPTELSPPISTYFEARNAHDGAKTAALFTEDGRVHDEQNDYRGRAAIQRWAEQTSSQYRMTQTPKSLREEEGATLVTAEVAGDFPGSPIELTFRFVTGDNQLRELQIG